MSLVRDYYIHSSGFIHDDDDYDNTKKQQHQHEWGNEEQEDDEDDSTGFSYRYCDICRLDRADWLRYYCYSNKGLNRQLITICIKCLDKYNHIDHKERLLQRLQQFIAENNNSNGQRTVTIGGLIDVKTAHKARSHIMLSLKLISKRLNKNGSRSKSSNSDISSRRYYYYYAAISAAGIPDDDKLSYDTVMIAYDQSQMVREYFGNDTSSIQPENKKLWPLRYQAYKQFGI